VPTRGGHGYDLGGTIYFDDGPARPKRSKVRSLRSVSPDIVENPVWGRRRPEYRDNSEALGSTRADGSISITATTPSAETVMASRPPNKDDDVSVEIEMSREDYDTLIEGAREAGLPTEVFLQKAIAEGAFIAKNRRKGNRILVQSRAGLRELVG
jgi:hypothetical protein